MSVRRHVIVWTLVALSSIVISTLFHLDSGLGRRLGRDILNDYVTGEMDGELELGEIIQLRFWKTIVKDTRVYDPQGREVIYGETVHLVIDPLAAIMGELRFSRAHLWNGTVTLIDNEEGDPTFIDAFDSPDDPNADPNEIPFHAYVEDMDLHNVEVKGSLLGLHGLRVVDMHVRGRMEYFWTNDIEVWSATGRIVEPFPFEGELNQLRAEYYSDTRGARLDANLSRESETLQANLTYRPEEGKTGDTPFILDLQLYANPVSAQTMVDVGFDWAATAKGLARGNVRLTGPGDPLVLTADVETDGGHAIVNGVLTSEAPSRIEIASKRLALARTLTGAADIEVNGTVAFVIPPGETSSTGLELQLEPFQYDGFAIPRLTAKTTIDDHGIHIHELNAAYGGGKLHMSGTVPYAGQTSLHIMGNIPQIAKDPNLQKFVPGAKGAADFDFRLRRLGSDLNIEGWAALDDFEYGIITAHSLHIEGVVAGTLSEPKINLTLETADFDVAGYPLGHGDLSIKGGPKTYETQGAFAATGQRRAEFHAKAKKRGAHYVFDVDHIELAVRSLVWRGAIQEISSDFKTRLDFEGLRFANGNQEVDAKGTWQFRGDDDIEADVKDFDLAALRLILPDDPPDVRGRLNLHFEFKGDLDRRPIIVAEGTLKDGRMLDIEPLTAAYLIRYGEGTLDADAQIDLGGAGNFSLSVSGVVDPEIADVTEALRGGVYEADLRCGAFDLELLERFLGKDWGAFAGYADAHVRLSGPVDAPTFRGTATIPELKAGAWKALGLKSEFQYEYGSLIARVTGNDAKGELFDVEGSLLIDLPYFVTEPQKAVATLATSPWRLSVRVPPRSFDALPKRYLKRMPKGIENLQVAASLTLAGGAFRTRGDLHASFDWKGQLGDALCATQSNPRSTLRAELVDDVTTVSFDGLIGTRRTLSVQASAPTPLDEWLRAAEIPELPPTQLTATLDNASTEEVPFLCRYAGGPLNATLQLDDLFGADPKLQMQMQSDDLRARRVEPGVRTDAAASVVETPPAKMDLTATLGDGLGTASGRWSWWNGGETKIDAKVPIQWDRKHKTPTLAKTGQLDAEASFDNMPLQAVLAWMSGVVNVEGMMQGIVSARGPAHAPKVSGDLLVSNGRVDLRTLGQTLREVEGQAIFNQEGELVFDLHAVDAKGHVSAAGELKLDGLRPEKAIVRIKASNFPVRQEGSVMASLDSSAELAAKFAKEGLDARVDIASLEIDVPESKGSPQSLDTHPDVRFVDEETEKVLLRKPYLVNLDIDASERFSVRSDAEGFSAVASARLNVIYDDRGLIVLGRMDLHGGYFEVFGKRFDVQSGSMSFQGDPEVNPQVSLVATHPLRGTSGQTVTITLTGNLDDPDVSFSSTIPTESDAQIIALLMTGRARTERGSQTSSVDAGQQASNFLAGVAGGLFASTLRGQFGGLAPTFAVQDDPDSTETTLQVGFNVDSVIPDQWRNIIQGLYIEGSFTTRREEGGTNTTGQAQRAGFLIETQFPRSIVVIGTFAPPANWSLDLTWEP